jgi:HEAT repeat protein
MALLVKAPQDEPVDSLVRLLKLHPGEVYKAAVKHLENADSREVGNIVRLMHLAEANHLSKALKPLLEHPDLEVRRQVLEGLVCLKEPWAIVHLRQWLKASPQEATAAIDIAGGHEIMDLVPDLCAQLVRAYFRKRTVQRNIDIIVALGKIGDPYALPILGKVVHSIWPLYPRLRREMKQAVYQSLKGYPHQSCRPLVGFGLKSKNAQIRRICLEQLRSQQV